MTSIYIIPYTPEWLLIMAAFLICSIGTILIGKVLSPVGKERVLKFMGFYLLFGMIVFEGYMIYHASFTVELCLPLAFCSIMQLYAAYAALKKSQLAFEFCMLLGILGPIQAFFSPAWVFSGEEYLLADYFLAHGITITIPLYMTFVLKFRVRKFAFIKALLLMQVYVISVYVIDANIGANYMYLMYKPDIIKESAFGPWPYYIFQWHGFFYLVAIGINLIYSAGDLLDKKTIGKFLE